MLQSTDHEDAHKVAAIIVAGIKRVGEEKIIQVVTDTCSVMKAAWRIVESTFPWITCTCCAPHVISLELKDLAKIKQVRVHSCMYNTSAAAFGVSIPLFGM